ncbi:mucin-5AC-like [Callospermophilus lateralis]
MTVTPPLRTIPVVQALNRAHNGRVCSTWGDFHYKTFDGDVFRFPGLCNYVFSAHCGAAYEDFNVQLRRSRAANTTTLSRVIMKLDGLVLQLNESSVLVNGHPVQLPFSRSGVLMERSHGNLKVTARLGLVFMWDQDDDSLLLELDSKFANQTCGLCGDFNGIPVFSEFFSHDVRLTPIEFGNLQKMDGPTEQCQDPAPAPQNCSTSSGICEELLRGQLFSGCAALVDVSSYVEACRQDLCLCEQADLPSCICHTLAEYSRQCAHAGGLPQDWRGPDLCYQTCPLNMQHQECGSPCTDTCSNPQRSQLCEDHCVAGCFCPEGTVFDDIGQTGCVPTSQCSCMYNGTSYAPGASYSTDCTHTCSGGRWSCQEVPCQGTCSVLGGSHLSTFDEKQYTVHGDCSYVLTKPCNDDAFTVLAELRRCGLTESETCLKSVELRLGGGPTAVVVKASGEVFVNQIYTQLPVSTANVTLFRPSTFFIIAQTNLGVQLAIQLVPTMQVFVRLAPELRGLTCGLCGNFNSIQADDFRTNSGVVEGTGAAFANTWKTQAACPNVKSSFEDPCSLSVENEKYAQHWCSQLTSTDGPFAQCHATVSPSTYYSNCMFDTCNCEKSEDCMCAALSSYVQACAAKGVLLRGWRAGVCTKPTTTCPKSMTYHYHISTCQPTCRALSEEDVTCHVSFVPVDGCACPEGMFLDTSDKCVPAASCPCYHRGSMVPNGESLHDSGAVCTCTQGTLTCIGGPAPTQVCDAPMVYFDCHNATHGATGAGCQKSCHTLDMACYSPQCEPGCVCPPGLVADGSGGCIAAEDCPCMHNGASYRPGETIWAGCNTCTCENRMWRCTEEPCPATCALYGDGHFLTFDGQRYTFSGDCQYTLVQDHCGGNGSAKDAFRVVTENVPCGTTGTTCSKDIKIFLGSYELKLSSGKVEVVQKGAGQEPPYTIRQMGIYLVVDTDAGLVLLWDRRTSIFLRLSPEFKGRVCGLCGNFDGNALNDFTTRSQAVVGDALEFGNSWKLSPSCPDAPVPKDPCTTNPYRKAWAQKQCSIIHSATFATCHAHVEPTMYYEACVGDACACDSGGDCECFCTAVAAYAQACHEAGVCVPWRTPDVCPLFCDYYNPQGECEWHFQPCGAPCMRTCRNPSGRCLHDLRGLEGCYPKCPPSAPIFDEDKMQCVDKCSAPTPPPPCRLHGKSYRPGATVPSDKNCYSCICTENGVHCAYDSGACVCTYDGRHFHPGDVIYNTTDGMGSCISAHCRANGTVERRVFTCSPTTPRPPTTFSFSTSPHTFSSRQTTGVGSSPTQSTVHSVPVSTASSTATGTPLRTTPATSPVSPSARCGEKCLWSPWLDVSRPGQGADSGDFDTLQNLRAHGFRVCQVPRAVECRAEDAPEVPLQALGQHLECSPTAGLTCHNRDQASGLCHNYQIRPNSKAKDNFRNILCLCITPGDFPGHGCADHLWDQPRYKFCERPTSVECRAQFFPNTPLAELGQQVTCNSEEGLICWNRDQLPPICYNYEIRIQCCELVDDCRNETIGTPKSIATHPKSLEASTTTKTSVTTGSQFTSTGHTIHPTPVHTSTGTSVGTKVTQPQTTDCRPQCTWTKWFDVDFPDPGPHGGDTETYSNILSKGERICLQPEDITRLECRAENHPEVSIEALGQVVQCEPHMGLVCRNQEQQGPLGMCLNYGQPSSTRETSSTSVHTVSPSSTWKTSSTSVHTVSPSSTGKTSSTPVHTVSSSSTRETSSTSVHIVSPSSTRETSSTPVHTVSPSSTRKTSSTPVHTVSPSSTRDTSSTSVHTVSPSSTRETSSTSVHTVSPSSTGKTSSTPVHTVSPSSTRQTSSTPVPTSSISHTPAPESTHSSPQTTDCQPQCTWTKWFDVDFPDPGPHGGDTETYSNILSKGERICLQPEDITRLECRAENHPEVSIEALGQVVQCEPHMGLVCRNQEQQGPLGMCLNYEVRVLCCHTPDGCQTTVPVTRSSTSGETPTRQVQKTDSALTDSPSSTRESSSTPVHTVSPSSTRETSSTSVHTVSPSSTRETSSTSVHTVSPSSTGKTSSTSVHTVSPSSTGKTSSTSVHTVSPSSTRKTSSTSAHTVSPSSTRETSSTSVHTVSPSSTRETSSTSVHTVSPRSTGKTSSTSVHTVSPSSTGKTSSTSVHTVSPSSTAETSFTPVHTVSPRSTEKTSSTSVHTVSPSSRQKTSSTPVHTVSPSSTKETSSTSVHTVSPSSTRETSSTSVHTVSPSSTRETSSTSVHTVSPSSTRETSSTSVHTVSPSSTRETSSTSVHTVSPSSTRETSSTSVHTVSPSSTRETSSTSVHTVSPSSREKTSSTSVHTVSPSSTRETSSTSVHTVSPSSTRETSSTSVHTVSPSSTRETSSTSVHTVSPSSTGKTSSTPVHTVSPSSTRETSSTSVHTVSPSSREKTSSTSVHTVSPSSTRKTSSTSMHTVSPSSTRETSSTSVHTVSTSSREKTSSTSVHTVSPSSTGKTSSTSVHTVSPSSTGKTSSTSVHTVSPSSTRETSSTSVHTVSPSSTRETSSTSVHTVSPSSTRQTSSTSVHTVSPSSTWQTSSTPVPTSSISHTPAPESTHSSPQTTDCRPQCTWTKWFDVDFPDPGPHGGDTETYSNILSKGERICLQPEDITRLECRAENHPEVSIEALGQVVQCEPHMGLVCRNQEQQGPLGMCLNYEVRVLCCHIPDGCQTTVPVTHSSTSGETPTRQVQKTDSALTVSPSSTGKTSSTSVHTVSPSSMRETSSTSVHTVSPSSTRETSSTSVHTVSPSSTWKTSSTSVHTVSPSSTGKTSSISVHIISPSSTGKTSSTSVHTDSPSSTRETSSTSVHTVSPSSTRETSSTSVHTVSPSSTGKTSSTPVHTVSPSSTRQTSSTSAHTVSPSSTGKTSSTPVHTVSPSSTRDTSSTSVHTVSPSSTRETSSTSVHTVSPSSTGKTSSTPVHTVSPSSTWQTSSTPVPTSSISHTPAPESTHSSPQTTDCQPQCTWTKWFDVDFPDPGPHGGDTETYSNILSKGERICLQPEDITRLECRAENHPEVSIEALGQVVQCEPHMGLVCRNQEQQGPLGMCLNYEVRVLCCHTPDGCQTSGTPPWTAPPEPSSSVSSTSAVSSPWSPSSAPSSTLPCFCSVLDQLYPAGSIIYRQRDLSGHCYYALCSQDCEVIKGVDHDCPSTTPPPTSVSSLSMSTPETGCPNVSKKKGQTWAMPNCTQATCEGNSIISLHPRQCPEVKEPICANGYPALKVADQDGCCQHYQCQCVCSGWGDPHYITFDGTYYTFLDNCTYVLVQQVVPVYGHFRVLINNDFCDPKDQLSCPQAIIVEYHQDRVVLTRTPVGGVMTNQIIFNNKVVSPGFQSNGIAVSRVGIKMYVTIREIGVQVMFSGLIFSVEVPFSTFANNTEGQCGTCTNDKRDECRLPGGTVAPSCSAMSGHWKVDVPGQPHCHGPPPTPPSTTPQTTPVQCPPSPLCELILSKVFQPCHDVISPQSFYEGCVFDHCHMTPPDVVCSGLQLYAALCASEGVCIDWRGHTNHACPFTCSAGKVYLPCGPSSLPYCYGKDSTSSLALPEAGPITEGCFCPENTMLFSSDAQVCVPANCSWCLGPHGEPVEPGHTISTDCQECTCQDSSQKMTCHRKPCPLPPACPLPGLVPVPTAPKAGQCCPQFVCACNTSYCPEPQHCPKGSRLVLTHEEGACCPNQTCRGIGCSVNGTVYQPGAVVSSSLCERCWCKAAGSPPSGSFLVSCETQICNTHCPLPGESWSDPENRCVTYRCERHQDRLEVVSVEKQCAALSCARDQARLSSDGCCFVCPHVETFCTLHHRNQTIRQGSCSSAGPVRLSYCQGNCGNSTSMYSLDAYPVERKCQCCQELRTSRKKVSLTCADGSSRTFSYTQAEACGCLGQQCHSPGDTSHSGSSESESKKSKEQSQESESSSWEGLPRPPQ